MTTTWLYTVSDRKSGWARAWVTDDGCLSIMSDWGNYAYWWDRRHPTDRDSDHRDFLCHAGLDYITSKLAGGKTEIDQESTVEGIKERITRGRREGLFSREEARDEWRRVEATDFESPRDMWDWYDHSILPDACEVLCYRTPMQLQMFMKNCWPGLVEAMRTDLQQVCGRCGNPRQSHQPHCPPSPVTYAKGDP